MRHPLLISHKEVRKRVMTLVATGLQIRRSGNLIFVCGGNDREHLRPRFCRESAEKLPDFQIFQPEFAMKNYFSDAGGAQLDLGDFETLIGDLSHAIVIFPEAPGSFAETGYFANIDQIAEKVILVLDMERQRNDSFIMMGPARRFETKSRFSPNIQLNYADPDFSLIVDRINRIEFSKNRKFLDSKNLSDPYDLFCLVYKIFDILSIATFDDLIFVLSSLTGGHAPKKRARDIASILVGAKYIKPVGGFGHYFADPNDRALVKVRTGFVEEEATLKIEIAGILATSDPEFSEVLRGRANVD